MRLILEEVETDLEKNRIESKFDKFIGHDFGDIKASTGMEQDTNMEAT